MGRVRQHRFTLRILIFHVFPHMRGATRRSKDGERTYQARGDCESTKARARVAQSCARCSPNGEASQRRKEEGRKGAAAPRPGMGMGRAAGPGDLEAKNGRNKFAKALPSSNSYAMQLVTTATPLGTTSPAARQENERSTRKERRRGRRRRRAFDFVRLAWALARCTANNVTITFDAATTDSFARFAIREAEGSGAKERSSRRTRTDAADKHHGEERCRTV